MKKYSVLALTAFGLLACDDLRFDGNLRVFSSISIQQRYDMTDCHEEFFFNCPKSGTFTIPAGNTAMQVSFGESGNQKQIFLEYKDGRNTNKLTLEVDKNIPLSDNFVLSAAQIKQDFDLRGNIATQVTQTDEQSGVESCTYTTWEYRCHEEYHHGGGGHGGPGHGPGGPGHGPGFGPGPGMPPPPMGGSRTVCENVPVTHYGYQDVRFYYVYTTKDMIANFAKGSTLLAQYTGRHTKSDKIYTYQSICR